MHKNRLRLGECDKRAVAVNKMSSGRRATRRSFLRQNDLAIAERPTISDGCRVEFVTEDAAS